MEFLKTYFSKRYFLFFLLFFVIWYPGSFMLSVAYSVTANGVLYVALNTYFPLLIFIISLFYFRKSVNDWNDRILVGVGWIALCFLLAALLVGPIYGLPWSTVINGPNIAANWISLLAVVIAGLIMHKRKPKM